MANGITISGVHAAYGAVRVLEDVSLDVRSAETVVLLGTNGNGKSTLMKCIMGMVRPSAGTIVAEIDGKRHDLVGRTTEEIVDLGIALVPEGRRLFPKLTVEENLLLGAFRPTARAEMGRNLDFCYGMFDRLKERRHQLAGSMSGGEQQMLALGMALMTKPKWLLLDEPSTGLAPVIVRNVMRRLAEVNERMGVGLILVEQNVPATLKIVDQTVILRSGKIVFQGSAAELSGNTDLWKWF